MWGNPEILLPGCHHDVVLVVVALLGWILGSVPLAFAVAWFLRGAHPATTASEPFAPQDAFARH